MDSKICFILLAFLKLHSECVAHYNDQMLGSPFLTKQQSNSFLHRKKRSLSSETHCEQNKAEYSYEEDREEHCANNVCPADQICFLANPCVVHISTGCTVPESCMPDKNPCLHENECQNHIDHEVCVCSRRYEGNLCEKDCRPRPADIVFLVDVSVSQSSVHLAKQADFITDFINHTAIGPDDFLASVVTFSDVVDPQFYLNTYSNTASLLDAIVAFPVQNGVTFTHDALRFTRETMFKIENGGRNGVDKYVVVLTDGMSSKRKETHQEANAVRNEGIFILSVGVGPQVSHKELINIAGDKSRMFSSITQDAVNYIIHKQMEPLCENDCQINTAVDVVFLVDTSSRVDTPLHRKHIDVMKSLINLITIEHHNTQIGLITFNSGATTVYDIGTHMNVDTLQAASRKIRTEDKPANVSNALTFVRNNGFSNSINVRPTKTRQFVIMLTGGDVKDKDAAIYEAQLLKQSGVILQMVSVRNEINIEDGVKLASDPFHLFLIQDENWIGSLEAVVSEMEFSTCRGDIFDYRK